MYSHIRIIDGIFFHVPAPWIDSLIQRHQNSAKKKGAMLLLCAYNCSTTFFFSQKENADRPAISSEAMNTFFVNHKWFFSRRAGSHMF